MKKIFFWIFPLVCVFSSCKDAVVLDINAVTFPKGKVLFFGNHGDVMIKGLPDSTLSVRYDYQNNVFKWTMFKPAYMKINDSTCNVLELDSVQSVSFRNEIFNMNDYRKELGNFADLSDSRKFAYLRLSHLFRSRIPGDRSELDSIASLIAYARSKRPKIVMLDTGLVFRLTNGQSISFHPNGKLLAMDKHIKISFLQVFNAQLYNEDHRSAFAIKDTLFFTTVKSHYTPFGANQIHIQAGEDTKVSYNRYYRTVIPVALLNSVRGGDTVIPVNLQQQQFANNYSKEVYVDDITSASEQEWISVDRANRLRLLRTSNWLVPGHFFTTTINRWSYPVALIPILFVYAAGLLLIWHFTEKDLHEIVSSHGESGRWRKYFFLIFTALAVLCCLRVFIAYHLSYTAPYFTFAFPTAQSLSPLILLAVINIWLIFIVNSGTQAINLRLRFLLMGITCLLVAGIYGQLLWCFPFYWQGIAQLNYIDFMSWEVHYQSLFLLTFLVLSLSLSLCLAGTYQSAHRPQNAFYLLVFVFFLAFCWQKNSYSIAALLLACAMFFLLRRLIPNAFQLGYQVYHPGGDEKPGFGWKKLCFFLFACAPLLVAMVYAYLRKDPGYFINLGFFPVMLAFLLLAYHRYYSPEYYVQKNKAKAQKELLSTFSVLGLTIVCFLLACIYLSKTYNPLEQGRFGSRFTAYYSFGTIEGFGTRESEKQTQFFSELAKYTYPNKHGAFEPIHPALASFTDPVIKNDLSVPFGLIYASQQYWYLPVIALLMMWFSLLYAVMRMAVSQNVKNVTRHLTFYGLVRIYCVCMVVSSGIWLIASYYNVLPFTGRLVYGLGQDSIAEVFETVFLFGGMGVMCKSKV
jgi:hypothetical protein